MTKDAKPQIFRFMKINEQQRKFVDGRMKVVKRSSWIRIGEDNGRDIVESIFDKYDLDIDFYFMQDYKCIPWALIIFTEEQDIAGHIVQNRRGHLGEKIQFTTYKNYDTDNDDTIIPKVGVIHIPSKRVCEDNSYRSPLFKEIWDKLQNLDSRDYWILIMDKLPSELDTLTSEENAELWLKYVERQKRFKKLAEERRNNDK